MEVFTFNKSLLDRLNEANNVLHNDSAPVPASQVRREWSYMIELVVEPSGNQCSSFNDSIYLISLVNFSTRMECPLADPSSCM